MQQEGVTVQQPDSNVSDEVKQIRAEIQRYHNWLEAAGRLLGRIPHYRGWPKPRQLDPDTLEPLPEPPPPTQEEIIKELEKMLKDPAFRKHLEESRTDPNNLVEMPAGSPSPASPSPAGSRDWAGPGVRAACIG
jgi:hypothetical protein